MSNRMKGEVEIVLDKRRLLKVNLNTRRIYEEKSGGETLNQFFDLFRKIYQKYPTTIDSEGSAYVSPEADAELLRDLPISKVSTVLWSCLEWDDKFLTVERASELLDLAPGSTDDEKIAHVIGKLFEAYSAARGWDLEALRKRAAELRGSKKEEGPQNPPEPRGGGDPSLSSPRSGSASATTSSGA